MRRSDQERCWTREMRIRPATKTIWISETRFENGGLIKRTVDLADRDLTDRRARPVGWWCGLHITRERLALERQPVVTILAYTKAKSLFNLWLISIRYFKRRTPISFPGRTSLASRRFNKSTHVFHPRLEAKKLVFQIYDVETAHVTGLHVE